MIAPSAARPELSVVIPCLNEESVLHLLRSRLLESLGSMDTEWEVILVDDGSSDHSFEKLQAIHADDARFRVVALSRNFGQQAAVQAGLAYARGAAVAVMDADLQDPPEILVDCLRLWRSGGADVVFAVREKRKEGLLLRAAYRGFYRVLGAVADIELPHDAGDFCLMDRRVVNVLVAMPERNIFVRGMRAWAGFRQVGLRYERASRAAGSAKYGLSKLLRLAFDGIFSFSTAPLRLALWLGLAIMATNAAAITFVVSWRVVGFQFMGHTARELPGWAGAVSLALFLGGVQLLVLGIVGEYLARIYAEVKRRPRWVVRTVLGLDRDAGSVE